MSETIYTEKKQSQTLFKEQAIKENVFFSESLNGILDPELDYDPSTVSDNTLTVGTKIFSVLPSKIEREESGIFIDLRVHGFTVEDFINFDGAKINIGQAVDRHCNLISYSHPSEEVEYGLIRVLLAERT